MCQGFNDKHSLDQFEFIDPILRFGYTVYRNNLGDCGSLKLYLSVCVYISVCPACMDYISVTKGRILMKLGGNVGT